MEGGIIMGLSAALKEQVVFEKGGVKTANFADYPLLRFSETPEIEVHLVRGQKTAWRSRGAGSAAHRPGRGQCFVCRGRNPGQEPAPDPAVVLEA